MNQGVKLIVRSPEKAGVGGSTPSLATILFKTLTIPFAYSKYGLQPTITGRGYIVRELAGFAFKSAVFELSPSNCSITQP
jgi:hypothetical protein